MTSFALLSVCGRNVSLFPSQVIFRRTSCVLCVVWFKRNKDSDCCPLLQPSLESDRRQVGGGRWYILLLLRKGPKTLLLWFIYCEEKLLSWSMSYFRIVFLSQNISVTMATSNCWLETWRWWLAVYLTFIWALLLLQLFASTQHIYVDLFIFTKCFGFYKFLVLSKPSNCTSPVIKCSIWHLQGQTTAFPSNLLLVHWRPVASCSQKNSNYHPSIIVISLRLKLQIMNCSSRDPNWSDDAFFTI